jgi:hypothetical protein
MFKNQTIQPFQPFYSPWCLSIINRFTPPITTMLSVPFHLCHQPNLMTNWLGGRSDSLTEMGISHCHRCIPFDHKPSHHCILVDSSAVFVLETPSLDTTRASRAWCHYKDSCNDIQLYGDWCIGSGVVWVCKWKGVGSFLLPISPDQLGSTC